jgi:hypothetical protein
LGETDSRKKPEAKNLVTLSLKRAVRGWGAGKICRKSPLLNIKIMNSSGANLILQAQYTNYGLYFTKLCTENCSQMKYVINFKIIAGIDFIFPAAKICAGLADKICQEFATVKSVAKDLVLC